MPDSHISAFCSDLSCGSSAWSSARMCSLSSKTWQQARAPVIRIMYAVLVCLKELCAFGASHLYVCMLVCRVCVCMDVCIYVSMYVCTYT